MVQRLSRRVAPLAAAFALLVTIFTVVPATMATAAVVHVQSTGNSNNSSTSGTSYSVAFGSNNTAGNTIIAAYYFGGGSITPTCSDTRGNTYVSVTQDYSNGYDHQFGICYASNIAAGANTVTISYGGGARAYRHLIIHEYSGLATSNVVDTTATNTSASMIGVDKASSTAAMTRYDGDLIFGAAFDIGGPNGISAGTGFTPRASLNATNMLTEDKIQATGGTPVDAKFSFATNDGFHAQMVAFKAAGASASTMSTGIQYQQSHARFDASSSSSQIGWLANAATTGNTIVVTYAAAVDTSYSCSDSDGNTYTNAVYTWHASQSQSFGVCYALVTDTTPSSNNTVTVTFGSASTWRTVVVSEYSGISATQALDVYAGQSGTGAAPSSGSITTTRDGSLVYGAMVNDSGSTGNYEGAGFTNRVTAQAGMIVVEDKTQTTAGSVAATFNNPAANDWVAQVVVFNASNTSGVTVAGIIDPSLTFTVAGRATVCNSQSAAGFQTGSTATAVSLGHLNASTIGGGAQDLTLATNAANGFVVYIRTSGTTPNAFRTVGGATIADVAGSHGTPSASLSAGTAGFGYTTNDVSIAFGANKWAALTSTDASVLTASAGTASKSTCTGFQATVAATTTAGSYTVPIVYTAVPSF